MINPYTLEKVRHIINFPCGYGNLRLEQDIVLPILAEVLPWVSTSTLLELCAKPKDSELLPQEERLLHVLLSGKRRGRMKRLPGCPS